MPIVKCADNDDSDRHSPSAFSPSTTGWLGWVSPRVGVCCVCLCVYDCVCMIVCVDDCDDMRILTFHKGLADGGDDGREGGKHGRPCLGVLPQIRFHFFLHTQQLAPELLHKRDARILRTHSPTTNTRRVFPVIWRSGDLVIWRSGDCLAVVNGLGDSCGSCPGWSVCGHGSCSDLGDRWPTGDLVHGGSCDPTTSPARWDVGRVLALQPNPYPNPYPNP